MEHTTGERPQQEAAQIALGRVAGWGHLRASHQRPPAAGTGCWGSEDPPYPTHTHTQHLAPGLGGPGSYKMPAGLEKVQKVEKSKKSKKSRKSVEKVAKWH